MPDPESREEILDSSKPPSRELLICLGAINLQWALVETYATAALFSLLALDEHDFTILLGRLEIIPKLKKIQQILEHRGDDVRLKSIGDLIARVDALRPDRNALTHGAYQGTSKAGEYIFFLMGDAMFDKEEGRSRKMRVFTDDNLLAHANETADIFLKIQNDFGSATMQKLFQGQFRVPKYLRAVHPPTKHGKKR